MTTRIDLATVLTDPNDLGLLRAAQGSCVRNTIFPSGWKSPDEDLIIHGTELRLPTDEEKQRFDIQ